MNLRKSHLAGWFFRFTGMRLRVEKKDLKEIFISSIKPLSKYSDNPVIIGV